MSRGMPWRRKTWWTMWSVVSEAAGSSGITKRTHSFRNVINNSDINCYLGTVITQSQNPELFETRDDLQQRKPYRLRWQHGDSSHRRPLKCHGGTEFGQSLNENGKFAPTEGPVTGPHLAQLGGPKSKAEWKASEPGWWPVMQSRGETLAESPECGKPSRACPEQNLELFSTEKQNLNQKSQRQTWRN